MKVLQPYTSFFGFTVLGQWLSTYTNAQADSLLTQISREEWTRLNQTLEGRLLIGTPAAKPCYSGQTSSECTAAQQGYTDNVATPNIFGAYENVK